MLGAGLALVGLALVLGLIWIGIGALRAASSGMAFTGKGMYIFGRLTRGFYLFFVWVLVSVCVVMTLNCFILYHASTFSEQYFGEDDNLYELEELIALYNMVASQCNRLSHAMERDESGMVLYQGSVGKDGTLLDMEDMARE